MNPALEALPVHVPVVSFAVDPRAFPLGYRPIFVRLRLRLHSDLEFINYHSHMYPLQTRAGRRCGVLDATTQRRDR